MKKGKIYSIIIIILMGGIFCFIKYGLPAMEARQNIQEEIVVEPTDRQEIVEIIANSTFGELMT